MIFRVRTKTHGRGWIFLFGYNPDRLLAWMSGRSPTSPWYLYKCHGLAKLFLAVWLSSIVHLGRLHLYGTAIDKYYIYMYIYIYYIDITSGHKVPASEYNMVAGRL